MSKPMIQIDDLVREMTDEEFEQFQELANFEAEQQRLREEKQAMRLSLLERLGLTEDEAKILFG